MVLQSEPADQSHLTYAENLGLSQTGHIAETKASDPENPMPRPASPAKIPLV